MRKKSEAPCHYGWCVHWLDPETGKIDAGYGPIGCPCDHVPGWKSVWVEGQSRPAVPVKVRGRHGSRVQRSRRRHKLPKGYLDAFGGMLPPRSRA